VWNSGPGEDVWWKKKNRGRKSRKSVPLSSTLSTTWSSSSRRRIVGEKLTFSWVFLHMNDYYYGLQGTNPLFMTERSASGISTLHTVQLCSVDCNLYSYWVLKSKIGFFYSIAIIAISILQCMCMCENWPPSFFYLADGLFNLSSERCLISTQNRCHIDLWSIWLVLTYHHLSPQL
jgi:hypothetical protein